MALSHSAFRIPFFFLIAVAAIGALFLRLPHLDRRPMHTDEAVHAVKLGELLETGRYVYDPHDFHGPTLYYFTLPLLWMRGVHTLSAIPDEAVLRIVPALFGVGLILLLLLVADGIGRPAAVFAALLTAISPAMVFYSGYYIQEMLLVFFSFAAIACVWRYTRGCNLLWALAAGCSFGLMLATKETAMIAMGAMAGAVVGSARLRLNYRARARNRNRITALAITAVAAIFFAALFLSGFFTNQRAMADALRGVGGYFFRGTGGSSEISHMHPWYFYLQRLAFFHGGAGPWWSEGAILVLAGIGGGAAFLKGRDRRDQDTANIIRDPQSAIRNSFVKFLVFYTLLMLVVYSAIPYKTPWCMLGFYHGMILLAGVGAAALWRWASRPGARAILAAALLGGAFHLGAQAVRANSARWCADPRNPYVYAHTSPDLTRLAARAEALARVAPEGHAMPIAVVAAGSDYWPLPWYLRRFSRVGYWDKTPAALDGEFVIAGATQMAEIEKQLGGKYLTEQYGLRPGVLIAVLIREDLWAKYMQSIQNRNTERH